MEGFREGGSTTRSPVLDGTNYAYWKARMTTFLKSMDTKTWKDVRAGWTTPTVTNNDVTTVNPKDHWTPEEHELALANDKVMNVIFNDVDLNVFKLNNTCNVAKTDWYTLQTAYEETLKV
ncbi:hypothetical protein LIER_03497 [Lithospermum erythrorhizon]|uniref:Gag-pol polyprotein n=1 Tax=Lithospermum erythrorhizon TaxID=34254 RepID=A0AAV3NU51_LITER